MVRYEFRVFDMRDQKNCALVCRRGPKNFFLKIDGAAIWVCLHSGFLEAAESA